MKATEACYWIIGSNNARQAPAVAIDLHTVDGELANPPPYHETYTISMRKGDGHKRATQLAVAYARQHGLRECM